MTTAVSPARILLTRDWLLALLGALAAAALCVTLGLWQLHRYEVKKDRADVVAANFHGAPVPLSDVLPRHDSSLTAAQNWTVVTVRGHYCTDPTCVLYVRNRPSHSSVGYWQLVPLHTDSGTLLVVRGWLPEQDAGDAPADPPPVPDGEVTVTVRMRPTEDVLTHRTDPPGQLQSVNAGQVRRQIPGLDDLYTHAYGALDHEDPAPTDLPRPVEAPDISLGPHLAYTVQWWLFAIFFPVAWVVRARAALRDAEDAERRESEGEQDALAPGPDEAIEQPAPPPAGGVPSSVVRDRYRRSRGSGRRRARTRDEEDEDGIIDSEG